MTRSGIERRHSACDAELYNQRRPYNARHESVGALFHLAPAMAPIKAPSRFLDRVPIDDRRQPPLGNRSLVNQLLNGVKVSEMVLDVRDKG
jgi:hypothetical protein